MSRNFKRIAAFVLSITMLVSCFAFTGFAEDAAGGEAINVGLALSAESAKPGDEITVTLSISNNYNAAAMRWPVLYSKDFFELVGEDGSIASPIDSVTAANGSTTVAQADDFVTAAYANTHSAFAIQWFAGVADGSVAVFNSGVAVEAFTFKLKVKDSASGTGSVLIPADSTAFYDMALTDPADPLSYYDASGLTVTVSEAQTVVVESAADPELVAADGYEVCTMQFDGDDKTYLCGFSVEAVLDNGLTYEEQFTVNNGSYSLSSYDIGTGTVVTVYDTAGNVFAEYTIIIFGDLTGDGLIDISDISELCDYASYAKEADPEAMAYYYAADVYVDDNTSVMIEITDISLLEDIASMAVSFGEMNQTHTL